MIATIEEYKKNHKIICKFPARFLFIAKELNIPNFFNISQCPDLKIYTQKAPIDDIYLIYVSENVKYPSSIMGHTFFKIEGIKNNKILKHSISFYTIINSYNPLVLIYQNIFTGMKGIFSLQPYNLTISNYIFNEDRNIWEYKLHIDNYHKKLIYFHFWELKDVNMKYYFTSFNCSTLTYQILSITNKQLYNYDTSLWITPTDNVKLIKKYNLISSSNLIPSNNWYIISLEDSLSNSQVKDILQIIEHNQNKNISLSPIQKELLKATAIVYYYNNKINKKKLENILNKTESNISIDMSNYKLPYKIPPERQLSLSYSNHYMKISFLPASHLIEDYNKEYSSENELKIFYTSLSINKNSKIRLENFTLYGIKAFIPYEQIIKNLSYQAEISIKKIKNENLSSKMFFNANIGIGITKKIKNDIFLTFIPNTSLLYNKKATFKNSLSIYLNIYQLLNSKSLIKYEKVFFNSKYAYNRYYLIEQFFIKNFTPYFSFDIYKKRNIINKNFEIGIKYLF